MLYNSKSESDSAYEIKEIPDAKIMHNKTKVNFVRLCFFVEVNIFSLLKYISGLKSKSAATEATAPKNADSDCCHTNLTENEG